MKTIAALVTSLFICIFVFSACAHAGAECARPGCVRMEVRDELGRSVASATVEIRLPGSGLKLSKGMDLVLSRKDGVKKGPLADGDGAGADGDVEFDLPALGQKLAPGTQIMLTASAPEAGLAQWSTTTIVTGDEPINIVSENKYILEVVFKNEKDEPVPGLTATAVLKSATAAGRTATDGGENDADGKADGVIRFAGPALPAGETTVKVADPDGKVLSEQAVSIGPAAPTLMSVTVKSP